MATDFTPYINTLGGAIAAGLLVGAKKITEAVQDKLAEVRGAPTKRDQQASTSARQLSKLIDLTLDAARLEGRYKADVKSMVSRAVESIINEQREVARSVKVPKAVDQRAAIHDYKCAGEGLKTELVRLYMDIVDINGFAGKSPVEWSAKIDSDFELMVSRSNDWYDTWYVRTDLKLEDIRDALKLNRAEFVVLHTNLMNLIRDRSIKLDQDVQANKGDREKLFAEIADPHGWSKRKGGK